MLAENLFLSRKPTHTPIMSIERWQVVTGSVVALIVGYAVVIASQLLLGLLLGALVYLVGWLLVHATPTAGFGDAFSTPRAVATGAVIVVVLGYSLFIAGQILLGLLTAIVLFLVAWVTSPTGPLADR